MFLVPQIQITIFYSIAFHLDKFKQVYILKTSKGGKPNKTRVGDGCGYPRKHKGTREPKEKTKSNKNPQALSQSINSLFKTF